MAQERSPNPEKQLLGLIEGNRGKGKAIPGGVIQHQRLGLFSPEVWIGRASFLKDSLEKWFKGKGRDAFDVKAINGILLFVIFILAVYFIGNLIVSVTGMKDIPNYLKPAAKDKTSLADTYGSSGLDKSAAYYLEKVRQRNIFKMGPEASSGADSAVRVPSSEVIEATKHLKLVGISWSSDPDALIEDTKATRTFFVKRGQSVGEIKIQAIFKDKIILNYRGEEVELK